jgi:tRNA (guanine-N7-)-methyltransferase
VGAHQPGRGPRVGVLLNRRQVYGRRRGPKLRPHRRALLAELLPRVTYPVPRAGRIADPLAPFGHRRWRALWLEIGFGAGEHLAAQAAAHADVAMIGCEPYLNGVARLLSAIEAAGLDNIRIHADDARALIEALPDACLGKVFMLFPDPWPKTRHHKRRLVSEPFLTELARVMCDGAELRLATDEPPYWRWMLARLIGHPAFAWTARGPEDWSTRPPDWPETRYEKKALAAGRSCAYLAFLRRRRPPAGPRTA